MQSPQRRQQKLERKRVARERRRREARAVLDAQFRSLEFPKMSETLLDYAQPILPEDARDALGTRAMLNLAAAIWNAVVATGTAEAGIRMLEKDVLPLFGEDELEASGMLEFMACRKAGLFGGDPRLIIAVEVVEDGDQLHVYAACEIPQKTPTRGFQED